MRKILLLYAVVLVFASHSLAQGQLSRVYEETKRGLEYAQTSVLLGARYDSVGINYFGLSQPATMFMQGLPTGVVIEKAYLWWEHYGVDTVSSATIMAPSGVSQEYEGELIGSGEDFCWGPQNVFRADVTDLIEGNGNYLISGLPISSEAKDTLEDTDGATLLIVYSDVNSSNYGKLYIDDGFVKAESDTTSVLMENLEYPFASGSGKTFMVSTDLEYYYDASISMNGGSYYVPGMDYWDFEQKTLHS